MTGLIKSSVRNSFWYGYLIILIAASFINGGYNSKYWLLFSAVLYAFIAGLLVFGSGLNVFKLNRLLTNKYPVLLLLMALSWLILQLVLPMQSSFNDYLFGADYRPSWLVLNTSLSLTPERTKWLLLSNIMTFSLFVLSLCLLDSRRRVKELVFVIFMVGIVHATLGIFAKFSGLFFVDKVSLDGHFDAARGVFVNRNHFAAFVSLCLIAPLAMQFKLLMMKHSLSWLDSVFRQFIKASFCVLLIGIVALFLSESRGALLAFLLSTFLCSCVFFRGQKDIIPRRYFLLSVALIVIAVSFFMGDGMISRFSDNGLHLGERQTQWAITWQAIKNQFWFGYGGGSYQLVFQTMREYAELRQVIYDQAHNDYLHIWLEQGFVGLALWLGFIAFVFQSVVCSYWHSKSTLVASVLLAGLIVMVAILVQSMVDYPLQIMTIRCYFFVIVALLLSVPNIKHNS